VALPVVVAALALVAPVRAQTSDEVAIGEIVDGLSVAWNGGDADAWVQNFTDTSGFTNILGMHFSDREANRARHASLFETVFEGSRLETELISIHQVGREAAVVEVGLDLRGYQGLPPGISETQRGVLKTRLILALQKIEDRWWIIAAQNTAVLPPP
jgi:uncharacterized protein (TIGR02246 family)